MISQNIGAGGLMFETDVKFRKKDKVKLEIYQPLDSDKKIICSIPVLARIVWTKGIEKDYFDEGENRYKVGIELIKIGDENRRKIIKYIRNCLSKASRGSQHFFAHKSKSY